jgi:hypothetical protein
MQEHDYQNLLKDDVAGTWRMRKQNIKNCMIKNILVSVEWGAGLRQHFM